MQHKVPKSSESARLCMDTRTKVTEGSLRQGPEQNAQHSPSALGA